MRRLVLVLLVLSALVAAAACAPTYGVDEGVDAAAPEAGAVAEAGAVPEVGVDAGEAGVDAGCAAPATETFTATADTTLVSSPDSDAPERYGARPALTLRSGSVGLFRFPVGAKAASAITSGAATRVSLLLTPDTSGACDGGACAYAGGALVLYPVRNDWEEGSGDLFSGASHEFRTSPSPKMPWAAPGADGLTDRGIAVGTENLPGALPAGIAVSVGPDVLADHRLATWVAGTELSFRVGSAAAVVTVHSREAMSSNQRPRLLVTYCPR